MKQNLENSILKKSYEAFFKKGDSINLHKIKEEFDITETNFWNLIDSMTHRRLLKAYTMGGNYKITAKGIIHSEENKIAPIEMAQRNNQIRTVILDELAKAYENGGITASIHIEKLSKSAESDEYLTAYNLQVLDELGYVEPFTMGSYKITHHALDTVDEWRKLSKLVDEFEKISSMKPQQRGREFQKIIAQAIDRDGWRQDEGVRTSHEEMDVLINKGREYYLIECKWEKEPIQSSIVRELYGKLSNRVGVQGIIVSMSGFTSGAIDQAKDYANDRLLLFFGKQDSERLIQGVENFDELLTLKYQKLVSVREIIFE